MRPLLVILTIVSVVAMAQSGMAGTPIPGQAPLLTEVANRVASPGAGAPLPSPVSLVLLLGGLGGLISAGSRADRLRPVRVRAS